MLFTYGRFLSRQLVNTVTSDKLLYQLVSGLIKYQMFICYFLYIAGISFISACVAFARIRMLKIVFGQLQNLLITSFSHFGEEQCTYVHIVLHIYAFVIIDKL